MGLFKKNNSPASADADHPAPPEGSYEEIGCVVTVSKDGKTFPLEAEGSVRFYEDEMTICGPDGTPGPKGVLKVLARDMLIGIAPARRVQLRFLYTDVSRAFFQRKRTMRIELKDGRFAFIIAAGKAREAIVEKLAVHGIQAEAAGE